MAGSDHIVEIPGEGCLVFRPAGPGTRLAAALLDHLLLAVVILTLSLVGYGEIPLPPFPASALLLWILIYIAYFSFFEWRRGRTVGKAALGLRVVGRDGKALDVLAALIRNILRLVDILPASYLLGVVTMSIDREARRLGDLVGGTLVVRDAAALPDHLLIRLPYREKPTWPLAVLERIALAPGEYEVLRSFCYRTRTLSPPVRTQLATRLLAPLYARADEPLPPPELVEELLVDLVHLHNDTFGVATLVAEPVELHAPLAGRDTVS